MTITRHRIKQDRNTKQIGRMNKLINTIIVFVSIVIGLLFIDLFIFKTIIPHLSLDKIVFLERPMRTMAQNSKKALVPEKPYMVIVGDSYAKGNGDWFLDSDMSASPAPPYQTSHIMHRMLDTDIIAVARAGGDSIRTYTSDLVNQYNYINKMWIYELPEPDMILFYFYGGNDLNDNLNRLNRSFYPDNNKTKLLDREYFRKWLDKYVDDNRRYFPLVNFTSAAYIGKVAAEYTDRLRDSIVEQFKDTTQKPDGIDWSQVNVISLDGKDHQLGRTLQNFSMELDDESFMLGFYVFDEALRYACSLYPDAKKAVVYIPPVLDCYTFTSPMVQSTRKVTPARQREIGIRMELEAERIARKHGLLFVNTTPALRKAAESWIIHGPKDFDHLNKYGYHVFAQALAKALHKAGWTETYRDFSYIETSQ